MMDSLNSTNQTPAPNEEPNSGSSSLTLSLTPPLSDLHKEETSTISEHLSSIENDRSCQELEVSHLPGHFSLLLQNLPSEDERISQEPKPPSLTSSFNGSSIISLNGLEKIVGKSMESRNQAQSILEEILNDEQFKSENDSKDVSLDIFANVDLDDKFMNSYNKKANFKLSDRNDSFDDVTKRLKDFEELIAIKDTTIAALTSELDSFRELISNTSSNSLGTSTTEYKQFQEECHNKLLEYHNAIVHKDDQIEKLTNSLQQSILNREEMKQHFKNEIFQLQEQLEKTSNLLKEHNCQKTELDFNETCSKFENELNSEQKKLFHEVRLALNEEFETNKKKLESELTELKDKLNQNKREQEAEIMRLKELLENVKPLSDDVFELKQELDAKHSKEMEELRTYFEKKCADLEKNYSEEVFSQQSRKLSGSSSNSDTELSSDFIYNQPGPGGDVKIDYTKKDLVKLRQTVAQLSSLLDNYNLNELKDDDFENLMNEINKFELKNLIKYDLILLRNELQNKYHAELEILREDFDNRIDELNLEHENNLKSLEKKYLEEIEDLNVQLRGRIVSTAQQEVANSGEFEIDEVVQSYERRLQEQVTLAKIDIIAALENQIQRLVASDSIDDDWPEELLQLKSRFSEKYETDIKKLKEEHSEEIQRLKEDHIKTLNSALERARRRSLRDADSLSKGELELLKERDSLKKQTLSLKNLLGELIKYFTQCEDELNNTLVEELITKNLEKDFDENSTRDSLGNVKRVHITPNFNDLINLIDNSSENDLEVIDLKSELGLCLEKLKSDANAILQLSMAFNRDNIEKINTKQPRPSLEREMTSLTRKLINETQLKNELTEQLLEAQSIIQTLETDRGNLENQLEEFLERQKILESDLLHAKEKIAELIENGHKEIISEGYGENGEKAVKGLAEAVANLTVLQEKVRVLSENPGGLDGNIVNLLEDLVRVGSKIVEEAKKEKEDFKQQIFAADKKYKQTCQFLEDQAAEREQERDEAQKEINLLKEQLKEREKDKTNFERIATEVEHLEQQLREMSKSLDTCERRCKSAEDERKEAIDKIFELRDIIRDLEEQIKSKTNAEEDLKNIVSELELIVKHQNNQDTCLKDDVSDVEKLHQYVGNLESEVQKLRLSSEIAGSEGALQQIKNHLSDFEITLDKRTRDLEGLHSTLSTTCSSPSEDMSIRDVVHHDRSVYEECEIPLQQLARLREKLLRHSRAEDAAVKRIRDLELQLLSAKNELEESQNERDILKKQISDHLVLISNLQIRLDEQRIRAEHIEKQTNTSLEVQNYDLKNAIAILEEQIVKRDKIIAQLKTNIEETKKRLEDREKEISESREDELIIQMQEQLEFLRSENFKLKSKMDKENNILPNLVENIISDKNLDIEKLREKLSEAEKEVELFHSLNLDEKEIESLNKLRLSGISFTDIIDAENFEKIRKIKISNDSLQVSPIPRRKPDRTFLDSEPEFSTIDKIDSPHFYSLQVSQPKANSTEKHVRFEDEIDAKKVTELEKVILEKDRLIQDYQNRLEKLKELQDRIEKLQVTLEETETNLEKATETFQKEQRENELKIEKLELELKSQKTDLSSKVDEVKALREELNEEKNRALEREKELNNLQKLKSELKNSLKTKDVELKSNEETLKIQNDELKKLEDVLANLKTHSVSVEEIVQSKDSEISKLKRQNDEFNKEINHLQQLVKEKEKIISQVEADSKSLKSNLETIQQKMQETGNVVDLAKRLRDEQKRNSQLYEELHELKAQLLGSDKLSIEEITDRVQQELSYGAYLDNSLLNAVSDNSVESEDLEALKLSLRKQKSINKQLVKNKELVEKRFDELEKKYEILKTELDKVQYEDAIIIGELRKKLDSCLNTEMEYNKILRNEKTDRLELENQLRIIKAKSAKSQSLPEPVQDYRGLTKVIENLENANTDLRKEMKMLQDASRNQLSAKFDQIVILESKLAEMACSEKKLKDQLEQTQRELKLKTLELSQNQKKIYELEVKIRKQNESNAAEPVSDLVLQKIKDLEEMFKNDQKLMGIIDRLNYENKVLQERITNLHDHKSNNLPFDDPVSRANYLFAKYLRSESYRKALAWQKRYLISLLETYQTDFSVSLELAESNIPRRNVKNRFKSVAVMIVSIFRMKYLVRRWHSGKRITEHRIKSIPVQFQVGQPVSSQNFTKPTKSAFNEPRTDLPWFGTSPPSKEPSALRVFSSQTRPTNLEKKINSTTLMTQDSNLRSPALLSQYIERFNQIQNKLGLN